MAAITQYYHFQVQLSLLEFGQMESCRCHNRVQKADLQPAAGDPPDRVAIDGRAIRIDDEQ